jgi:hypothetical protein
MQDTAPTLPRVLTRNLVHKLSNQEVEPDSPPAQQQQQDQNYQFYKEYSRLYYANIILTNRLQQLLNEK